MCAIASTMTDFCWFSYCPRRTSPLLPGSMPNRKKPAPKSAPANAPQYYHCFACGDSHDKSEHGARLVNWDRTKALHGTFYVGNSELHLPVLPAGFGRSVVGTVVDSSGNKTARNGNPFVGYCCHAKFQLASVSTHHSSKRKAESAPDVCTRQTLADLRAQLEVSLPICYVSLCISNIFFSH